MTVYFVYILKSKKDGSLYIGVTADIRLRLTEHNSGKARYSSTKRPFALKWFCGFPTKQQALAFEKYLKQGSGHAFTNKHLL